MHVIPRGLRSERGAVFVHVGIAAFVLIGFGAFVADYGIMWTSRRQAQNAADAAALAGAVARGFDHFADPGLADAFVEQSAALVAAMNPIWQQPGVARVMFDCPENIAGRCVRVNVYRNGEAGSAPLPTMFGPLLDITSQGVRATATALVGNGNATRCLRPFALADEWVENLAPADEFNRYAEPGAGTVLTPDADAYIRPDAIQAVSYDLGSPGDFGRQIDFTYERPQSDPITAGFMLALDLPGTLDLPAADRYVQNITECNAQPVALHNQLPLVPNPESTFDALATLVGRDPDATWNDADQRIENSCAPACAPFSPRLIAIALYDPDEFQWRRATEGWTTPFGSDGRTCPDNAPCITVSNIVGFFIEQLVGATGGQGRLMKYPGMKVPAAPTFVDDGSWLVTTNLIR